MKTVLIALFLIVHLLPGNSQHKVNYTYDKNNRLTGYEYTGTFTCSFLYDQTGNRTEKNIEQTDIIFVKTNSVNQLFMAYPNPMAGNEIFIQPANGQDIISVELFNIKGNKIGIHTELINSPARITVQKYLPAGVYFLRIESENSMQILKIVKLKE